MAIHIDLQKIITGKPAGDYFLYYDRSVVPDLVSASGLRILVGQSRKGVVNTLTYHDDFNSFKRVYGDINRGDERKGSYFHRSAFQMLENSPIACLNLRAFDDELDKTSVLDLSTVSNKDNANLRDVAYTSLFDTERFWKVDPKTVASTGLDNPNDNLLSMANVGSNKLSIIIRKSFNSDYDGTIQEYYNDDLQKSVPDYLIGSDLLADSFIDVYVFGADFSDLDNAQSNPAYGHLFDSNGVIKTSGTSHTEADDGLTQLAEIQSSLFLKKYTASVIPDLVDTNNSTLFIGNLLNNDFSTIGLIGGIDTEVLDSIAISNSNKKDDDTLTNVGTDLKYESIIDFVGHGLWKNEPTTVEVDDANYDGELVKTISYDFTTKMVELDYSNIKASDSTIDSDVTAIKIINPLLVGKVGGDVGAYTYDVANQTQAYLMDIFPIKIGDKYVGKNGNLTCINSLLHQGEYKVLIGLHTSLIPLQASGDVFPQNVDDAFIYPVGHANAGSLVEYGIDDAPLDDIAGTEIALPTQTPTQLADTLTAFGTLKNVYLAQFNETLGFNLTPQITSVSLLDEMKITLDDATELDVYTSGDVNLYFQRSFDEIVTSYKPFISNKYKPRVEQFVNGTASRQNEILNVLSTTLISAIKDRERLDFRYLVDGFESYIENGFKEQFTKTIKERNVGAAIISAPSIDTFKKSTNPYFKETTTSKFDASYIRKGGNTSLPYSQTFSLPKVGSNHGYIFTPWFIVDDNGSDILFPPAPAVSNNYVTKSNSGRPYDPVFGTDSGTISASGIKSLEYDFTEDDRNALEKSGINPIVFKQSGGNIILGNRTAETKNSALRYAHVNELIIQLYEQMRPIALYLLGKYNTDDNRKTVKKRMDGVTRNLIASGVLQYAENVVDKSNNTGEIVSEGMAVMDTIIVPNNINEKVVYRLIINRTTDEITSTIL